MIKLGAHQSIAGGLHEALNRINSIGGNCLQIFSSSPRGWNFAKIDEGQVSKFLNLKSRLKIDPIYFHASYLVNLADDSKTGHLSKLSLIAEMNIAPSLKIKGSIIHLGSFKDQRSDIKYQKFISNIIEVLNKTPKDALFIIENAGNKKIGQTLDEISKIVKDVNNPRVRLCLDTCHLFSNGYGFKNEGELNKFIEKLDELELLEKLEVWHINDSRDPFSSGRDRHENIGKGTIGIDEFKTLLNHPKTKEFPFIIETPGFDGNGPDKKNINALKNCLK
ncbi:MAG: putative endonuclease 4 [Candidatus Roizmanbacteria bacterium GW2011_GWA2_35_19]|uniref:Putative endonuclease 4 n=2 Tax=Candidatus Roizmaniibacteriota TaxID=1752723 RepID=A0A0G0BWP7_9BACT|nr:MAG: putative endonuclease 4 [Candidatus Roizmanbacteria bacterium GW2011_GWC2_35_12]KKP73744.1 MAG: putative endonuclease 4 [Candidatus Roizmanbacteria bacterium GW2011_GWA2_35_19]